MRNLITFIWKNQFTVVFLLLETLAVYLIVTNNSYQRSQAHSMSVAVAGEFYSVEQQMRSYINLGYENEVLRQQNSMLQNQLYQSIISDSSAILNLSGFEVRPSIVLNSTYNQSDNHVIANIGRQEGIEIGMGAQSPEGVLGIVTKTSEHFTSIMPLIHSQSRLSCELEGRGYYGLLKWDGIDHRYSNLEDIPNHLEIDSGMTVITRGAGVFPKGVLVGYAVSSEKNPSTGFQSVKVKLATNFEKLTTAYIFKNELKAELDSLMIEIEPDEQ